MKIQNLNNENLLSGIKDLSSAERKIGLEVLKYICEIERRKCYINLGYSGLFSYLTRELKYDESSAYKKIESAKLLKEFPSLEEKISSGKITPTNLTILATTLKSPALGSCLRGIHPILGIKNGLTDKTQKLEILNAHENKSKIELQKSLFQLFGSEAPKSESKKQVSPTEVRISLTITEELQRKMDKLKSLRNKTKILSTVELLEKLIDEALENEQMKLEKSNAPKLELEKVKTTQTRYIPTRVKKSIWKRAEGKCEWTHPITKVKCNSLFYLQYDHLTAFSLGGNNSTSNIRLLCSNHNLHSGISLFGLKKMKRM